MTVGLASAALVAEVRKKVREQGLVVWLDADRKFAELARALGEPAFEFSYPVVCFDGSYLELMLALQSYGSGLHPEHVLIHLPGLNKDTIKETPVYELYKAGTLFEKNLETLVREAAVGVAKPDEVDAFVRAPALSLAGADQWLSDLREAPRDRLGIVLETFAADELVMRVLAEDPLIRGHLPESAPKLMDTLERTIGLAPWWRAYWLGERALTSGAVATLVASWLMTVEFVDDLRGAPVTPELQRLKKLGPVTKECCRIAARFRETSPDAYELFAGEVQERLDQERTSHHAAALGAIDTFRFEEATTRAAAIAAVARGDWETANALAVERTPESCFWVRRSPALQRTWEIVRLAASLGQKVGGAARALERCASLEEAVERYVDKLAPLDRDHRAFEQRANAVLAPDLEDYDALLDVRASVRAAVRVWSDAINRAFFALCLAHGPLPHRGLRQRAVYDDVVQPLIERGGRVAFVLVDALRFEMAQALAADFKRDKFRVNLGARLAELPTITAVGMNALAPVESKGRLRIVRKNGSITGLATASGFSVLDPAARVRVMTERSVGASAVDLELEQFQDMGLAKLQKRVQGKPLVVVRSRELDTAGEHGLHLGTFEATLALLKSAVALLAQAGVEHFVIASDHGFLLQDPTAENVDFGVSKRVPSRRHALLDEESGMPDVLEVPLSALEYDVEKEGFLVFRPDTALWKVKDAIAPFVHGGNSLEERVIPVLVLERETVRGKTTSKYEVVARAEPAHLGRQRLRVAVRLQNRETGTLGFLAPKAISLALRIPDRPDVAITLVDVAPPATLAGGRVLVPPNRDEALVEFELEAEADDKVRVEIFHPDETEQVTSKVVEGFFDVARNRRVPRAVAEVKSVALEAAPAARVMSAEAAPAPAAAERRPGQDWSDQIGDPEYRRVLEIIAERLSINESELQQVLGSARRVRAFALKFDELVKLVPFEIEVLTVNGMKAYARKKDRD